MEDLQPTGSLKMPGQKNNNQTIIIWILAVVLMLAFAMIGWLTVQWYSLNNQITNLKAQNQELQGRVLQLTESSTPVPDPATEVTDDCDPTVTADLKANIADAVNSGNYAALEGYMNSSVNVILAASEGVGPQTPTEAVASMDYLNSGADPWVFEPDAATIATWDAGFYTDYFDDNTYVGRASNGMVVVFDFDECGKINEVFMVANEELLM